MFRATSEEKFEGPHQKNQPVRAGEEIENSKGAIIMIHGRGATAESIVTLANELDASGFHLVAPQAAGFQWYPNSFLAPAERNEPGLSSGLQAIFDIMTDLESKGINKEKIVFLGFSQGACLASEFVARHPRRYGGLIAFSGGLIGDELDPKNYSGSLENTPAFFGCSDIDPHIPEERVHESTDILEKLNAAVTKKIYPNMGHTINRDELQEAEKILNDVRSN